MEERTVMAKGRTFNVSTIGETVVLTVTRGDQIRLFSPDPAFQTAADKAYAWAYEAGIIIDDTDDDDGIIVTKMSSPTQPAAPSAPVDEPVIPKKRHRRTKAEMEAARAAETAEAAEVAETETPEVMTIQTSETTEDAASITVDSESADAENMTADVADTAVDEDDDFDNLFSPVTAETKPTETVAETVVESATTSADWFDEGDSDWADVDFDDPFSTSKAEDTVAPDTTPINPETGEIVETSDTDTADTDFDTDDAEESDPSLGETKITFGVFRTPTTLNAIYASEKGGAAVLQRALSNRLVKDETKEVIRKFLKNKGVE